MKILKIRVSITDQERIPPGYDQNFAYDFGGGTIGLSNTHGACWFLYPSQYEILEEIVGLNAQKKTAQSFSLKDLASKMIALEEHLSKVSLDI